MHENLGTRPRFLHRRSAKLLAACFVALVVFGTSGCAGGVTAAKSNALVVTPNSVDFKGVLVGQKNTQTLQLSNAGSTALNVQQIQVTGAGFQVTPPALPLALAPGANQIFNLAFAPVSTGSVSGTLTIGSNDAHSPVNVTVLGIGETISSHTVALSWNASTSSVIGYFVYRGDISGGPYTRVTTSSVSGLNFTDSGLITGATYYYVITAVDGAGVESVFSNQASVVMPNS
jgi:Abnormal spindle-like microcephaly-assoc'd, ASPM-SPD-2-Hydin